jgi:hypothetical protein
MAQWRCRAPAVVEPTMKRTVPLILALALCAPLSLPAAAQAAKKEPSAGQTAARERQKQCGAEWKQAKAAKTVAAGTTWPKFWSDCNKRLKGTKV